MKNFDCIYVTETMKEKAAKFCEAYLTQLKNENK